MDVKRETVHYISSKQTHVARKKDVLSFRYKDYEFYVLNEDKSDAPYILTKDQNGEYWILYNFFINYRIYERTINDEHKDFNKDRDIAYCDFTLEKIKNYYDNFIDNIKIRISENKYFNIVELEYLSKNYTEFYLNAIKSRENFLELNRQKEESEQKEREETRKNIVKTKNKEFFDKIWSMKIAIHEGKLVLSETYEYYKDDDYYKKTIQNNFLYLFKEYNIDVPLATQGFINNKLYGYDFGEKVSKSWGKYNGTVLYDSLNKLKSVVDIELSKSLEKDL